MRFKWGNRRQKSLLLTTVLASLGAFLLVGGILLLVDPGAPKHEAIKTGGLAGGAIVALYALWLNDRRRKVEEARQELERQRIEHDRSRVADDRFARAVELLGHEAEQVRVGAMHALAGLAKSRPEYTQTVLDILCAYLRRPFKRSEPLEDFDELDEIELEVRLTSQRLIEDLLPRVDEKDPVRYDLNLTKAHLEYFDLSYRQVGDLVLRVTRLNESNAFHHMVIHGDVFLTEAESKGRLLHAPHRVSRQGVVQPVRGAGARGVHRVEVPGRHQVRRIAVVGREGGRLYVRGGTRSAGSVEELTCAGLPRCCSPRS